MTVIKTIFFLNLLSVTLKKKKISSGSEDWMLEKKNLLHLLHSGFEACICCT